MKKRISVKEYKQISPERVLTQNQLGNVRGSGLTGEGLIDIDDILDKLPFGLGRIFKYFA